MHQKFDGCKMATLRRLIVLPVLFVAMGHAAAALAAVPPQGEGGAPYLDVRDGTRAEAVAQVRNAGDEPAGQERAARELLRDQGPQATLALDPTTATVRSLVDLSGALTGPSGDAPREIALAYVTAHRVALGLTQDDLATLRPDAQEIAPDGTSVVRWRQTLGGVGVYDNGLSVAVDRAGRVLSVGGSPLHEPDPNTATPGLSASEAADALRDSVGASGGEQAAPAERVYFDVNGAARLAWHLSYQASPTALYDAVVDATTGRVLHRANLVRFAVDVNVFPHYPGAPAGGTQQPVDIADYLTSASQLAGPNATAYADLNDNNSNDGGAESVNPSTATTTFDLRYAPQSHVLCLISALCSWDHAVAGSWSYNKAQDAVQAFWFVNVFHDHLAAAPIGLTSASGAFESGDRLIVNTDDGANTGTANNAGRPDANHINNANMSTPADGSSPRMQMYLFGNSSEFRDVNGGDAAEIVFHEYTHGLSSRLIHDADGGQALNVAQAGAMGEAWSDWYALDFLNRGDAAPKGMGASLVSDTAAPGEVRLGAYTDVGGNVIRTQPIDCPVGASASVCPGTGGAGSGGYTYGDFGRICSCGPEVHADGEIWAETLWDLRTRLIAETGAMTQGADAAEQLVTGAMRLSPPEPSYLDMRNAMLLAANGTSYRDIVWDVFAQRGMGFFAGTVDGSDVSPAEDFSVPPAPGAPIGTLSGAVTDVASGHPVAGITVSVGGHTDGESVYAATTDSAGHYSLPGLPDGTYGKVFVLTARGYDGAVQRNVVVSGATRLDFALRHNWAATASGGAVESTNDDTYASYDCGAAASVDGNQGVGWSSWRPASPNYPSKLTGEPATVTLRLPREVDIASFAADPGATCGDDSAAMAKTFTIETSPDNATWTLAYDGRSASTDFNSADAGTMKTLVPSDGAADVRYVRLTLLAPQSTAKGGSGRDFIDLSEFAVYGNGTPTAALSVPASAAAGDTVALDASGSTDDGRPLTSYAWDFDGDGTVDRTTSGPVVHRVYATEGTFVPAVTVTDDGGSTATASGGPIVVGPAPVISGDGLGAGSSGTGSSATATNSDGSSDAGSGKTQPAPAAALLRGARNGGVSIAALCPLGCAVTATLRLGAKVARRLGLVHRTLSRIFVSAPRGAHTLRLAVRRAVLTRLRAAGVRSLRLALVVAVTDPFRRTTRLVANPVVRSGRR